MAYRYWGKLDIPSVMLDAELTEALRKEGVDMDKLEQGPEQVNAWIEDGIFTLEDSEAIEGCWEDLEKILRLKGIPFDRENSGNFKSLPERVIFRPAGTGISSLDRVFILFDGEPVVEVAIIRRLLSKGTQELKSYMDTNFPLYPPLSYYVR
jgi:hypothetical protein